MTPMQLYRQWFYPKTLNPVNVRSAKLRNWIMVFGTVFLLTGINAFLEEGLGRTILGAAVVVHAYVCMMRVARLSAISEALDPIASILTAMDDPKHLKMMVLDQETGEETTLDMDEKFEMSHKELSDVALQAGKSATASVFASLLSQFHGDTSCNKCKDRGGRHAEHDDEPAESEEHA